MLKEIRVVIFEDHPHLADSYFHLLQNMPEVKVVGVATCSQELNTILEQESVDVLLFDVNTSILKHQQRTKSALNLIPRLIKQQEHNQLSIIIISLQYDRALIQLFIEAGIKGHLLKCDLASVQALPEAVKTVARGGVFFTQQVSSS